MKIAYSELSDNVYIVTGKGKEPATNNFINVILLWLCEGTADIKVNDKIGREVVTDIGTFDIILHRKK